MNRKLSYAIFGLLLAQPALAAPLYTITDLGTLTGGDQSVGYAINASGQVTGKSTLTGSGSDTNAFLYTGGTMQNLGAIAAAPGSAGFGINASGVVTGATNVASGAPQHAFTYDGTFHDLAPGSTSFSTGYGINSSGWVTGIADFGGDFQAYRYTGTTLVSLGALGGDESVGNGINSSGHVVGTAENAQGRDTAFIYNGTSMAGLGTLGGLTSNGTAINDSGFATGYSEITGNTATHAFRWNGTSMQDLLTLGGSDSRGLGINNAGLVTGLSLLTGDAVQHAFVYDGVMMFDLNTLILATDSLKGLVSFYEGTGINDDGQIVANGCYVAAGGECHAFVLTPTVPLPAGIWLLLSGGGALAGVVRGRRGRSPVLRS